DGVQQSQANAPTYYYLMRFFRGRIPEATGNDLKLSAISAQVGTTPSEGTAFVQLGFNSKGNKKFQEITQAEAFRGQSAATAAGQGSSNDLNVVTQYAQHFAIVGLGIYAAFLYGAILLFGVTLTLPGFAGLILTIGVAADANVVIFERIKEEVRSGKSVRAGIAAGYAKGFHTIVDANVVTLI